MRKSITTLAVALALVAGLAAVPALYAHDSSARSGGSMMGSGMMGQGMMGQGMMGPDMMGPDMMGQGGMMDMMGGMSGMMESCGKMMQSMTPGGSGRPNEQWRQDAPGIDEEPDTSG